MTASLSISNARAVEGDTRFDQRVLDFDLELSGIAPTDVGFDIVTLSGTADRGQDFVALAERITIPQGETRTTVTVEILEDTLAEADETLFLEVRDIAGAVLAGNAAYLSAEGLIETDDGDTRPAVLVGAPRVVEGGAAVFEVTLSRPFATDVAIPYRTAGITARPGEDFTETTGSLDIPAGETAATVTVPLSPDSAIEPSERVDLVLDISALETAGPPEGAVGEAVILDDDAGGGVVPVLTVSDARGPEGDSRFDLRSLQFTAELSAPAATDPSFRVVPASGTADADVDFVREAFTVTFPAGTTHRSFTLDLIEDEILEPDESVRLELRDPEGLVFEGGAPTVEATAVIDDDDSEIRPALFVSDPRLVEGAVGTRQAVFEITLSRAATTETQIPFETIAGSAEAGADFAPASGTLTLLPGQREASVAVDVVSDTAAEDTERFDLRLDVSGLDLANGVAGAVGTATILDDDASGGLTPVLSILDARQVEGDSRFDLRVVEFTVGLSTAAPSEISFAVETAAGSATEGVDFESVSRLITVEAGQTAVTVPVNIIEDTLIEGDEAFRIELSDPEGARFAGGTPTLSALGIIAGDDSDIRRALLARDIEVVEGDAPGRRVVAEVELSRPADSPVTVAYTTAPRSGASADDIGGATGVLVFAPGQTRATIEFTVEGDEVPEPTEQVDLILAAPQGAAFSEGAGGTRATLTILDDDASDLLPVISVSDARQVEGDSRFDLRSLAFEISLDRPAPADITLDATTASASADEGADFEALDRQVTISAGQTTQTILVNSVEDEEVEPDETFTLELANAAGGVFAGGADRLAATGTILNDDGGDPVLPALSVANISVTEPASGTATATFTIAAPVPAGLLIQGQYVIRSGSAEAGADFTAEAGSFQILPGTLQTTVSTEVLADAVPERPESFVLELFDLVNAGTGSQDACLFAIGTIEDPQPPVISIEPATLERAEGALGGSVFGFKITRSGDESVPVSIDIAVEGTGDTPADADDFASLPGSIFLDAGVTEVTPTITVRGDGDVEPDETFRVTLSNATNGAVLGNATAIGTILDDDGNAAPTAVTDIVAVAAGSATTLDLAANDTDPDDDPLAVAEAGAASGAGGAPRDGSVSASGGTARYTPDFGFQGTDSFLYTVTDGSGATDVARAFVTVGDPGPAIREDGVLRGTDRADVMTLAQNAIYLGNEGPDTYLVSEAAVEDRVMVFEDDADTLVQLVEGLLIVESLVVGEAIQLTLANNARVQILGAPEMTFDVGGNATTGTTGTLQDYDSFVADTLGAVPDGGVLAGGPLIVGEDLDLLG